MDASRDERGATRYSRLGLFVLNDGIDGFGSSSLRRYSGNERGRSKYDIATFDTFLPDSSSGFLFFLFFFFFFFSTAFGGIIPVLLDDESKRFVRSAFEIDPTISRLFISSRIIAHHRNDQ